jgi:hypothetical protein
MGDHDSLFKRAFSVPAHAAGELLSVLPATLTSKIDLATLALTSATFVDSELSHRHADLLFTARIAGRSSCIYFLFEHQSEPDPLMPWRVLEYMHRIWAAVLRENPTRTALPPILPIVVHHGVQGWTSPRSFHELVAHLEAVPELRPYVPDFELVIDDLASADDSELRRRPLATFPKVTLWLLRDARSAGAFRTHLVSWAQDLTRLTLEDPARDDLDSVLRYVYGVLDDAELEEFRKSVIEVAPLFGEAMASFEKQLIEKGRQEGRREGRQEGRDEHAREMLGALLRSRFGAVDSQMHRRIAEGSMADVQRWLERAMIAASIEEIFE